MPEEPASPAVPSVAGLAWRPLGIDDLDAWFALIDRIQSHDRTHELLARCDLDEIVARPWVDLEADSLVGVDPAGDLWAWGRVVPRPGQSDEIIVGLPGGVDPTFRNQGIGPVLLTWQVTRGRVAAQSLWHAAGDVGRSADVGDRPRVGAFVEDHDKTRQQLFEAAGFVPTRWFTELALDLPGPVAPQQPPFDGVALVRVTPEMDESVRAAFNRAFAGQWGTPRYTSEQWRTEVMAEESIRRDLSFAIVDESAGQREVVGFVLNAEYEQDWPTLGHCEGYTEYVGVVPEWRSRGLATQLLRRSAKAFAERGHSTACLHVDNANPTEAMGVYTRAGYHRRHASAFFSQPS